MTREFYRKYLEAMSSGDNGHKLAEVLAVMNPNKFLALKYLLAQHRYLKCRPREVAD